MAFNPFRRLFKDSTGAKGAGSDRRPRALNPRTGMGTQNDRALGSRFVAQRMERVEAEATYQMSWAAAKMIDIPVDDMFVRGRRWMDDDEESIKKVMKAERKLNLMATLADAIKVARIYGTGLMIICTDNEGDFEKPLVPEEVQEGQIQNLWVVDRHAAWVKNWQTDPTKPGYGKPYQYYVHSRIQGLPEELDPVMPGNMLNIGFRPAANLYTVHESRVIRFDSTKAPQTEGWIHGPFEREWGISFLTRVIDDVLRDVAMATGAGHLMEEASVWVNKIEGYKEALMGRTPKGDASPEEIAQMSSLLRSIWRTQFIDSEDDAMRVAVTFAGYADVLNNQSKRLAAMADIPYTRFMSESPAGMNATGESDANNYGVMVQANQNKVAKPALEKLDPVIARHAGLGDKELEYEWMSLFDLSEKDKAEASKLRTEAIMIAFGGLKTSPAIDEDEVRELLSKDDYAFMPLSQNWEPPEDPAIEAARMKIEADANKPPPAGAPPARKATDGSVH